MMIRLWKTAGLLLAMVLLALCGVAAYDAFAQRGISRLEVKVGDLRDSVRIRDANADLGDEQARRQHDYILGLNAVIDRQGAELRKVTAFADSVRDAARPKRKAAGARRGVDVDTLFLGAVPHVVARPVTDHLELLEGVIRADSLELVQLRPYADSLEVLRDSLTRLDSTRVAQIAERDRSIELRDGVIATQDTIIAQRNPRCGRKCGMGIGAGVTAVIVWIVTQVVRAAGGGK